MEAKEVSQLTTANSNSTTTINETQETTPKTLCTMAATSTSTLCGENPTTTFGALDAVLCPTPNSNANSNGTTPEHAQPEDPSSINPTILLNHIVGPLIKEVRELKESVHSDYAKLHADYTRLKVS